MSVPVIQKERELWTDYIRVIAAFGVVLVHVAADVITEWGKVPQSWWWTANVVDSLARGCVPIFIMVSGALLLPGKEGYTTFFKKRFSRVLVPFVVWTVIYLLWKKIFYAPDMTMEKAFQSIVKGDVYYHLWFFYILAGLYLVTPLFRVFVVQARSKDILYVLGVWFLFTSLIPFLEKFLKIYFSCSFHLGIFLEPLQGFIGYFLLGYYIRRYAEERLVPVAAMVWTFCLCVCAYGTYMTTRKLGYFSELFYDNLAPTIVLYCASFFVMVKYWVPRILPRIAPWSIGWIRIIAKTSLGIYVFHPIVLDVMIKGRLGVTMRADSFHSLLAIPLMAISCYVISMSAVTVVQRIPYLKRIV